MGQLLSMIRWGRNSTQNNDTPCDPPTRYLISLVDGAILLHIQYKMKDCAINIEFEDARNAPLEQWLSLKQALISSGKFNISLGNTNGVTAVATDKGQVTFQLGRYGNGDATFIIEMPNSYVLEAITTVCNIMQEREK